jgi:hypothetical protein
MVRSFSHLLVGLPRGRQFLGEKPGATLGIGFSPRAKHVDAAPVPLRLPPGTRVTYQEKWRLRFKDDYRSVKDRKDRDRIFRRVYGDLNKHKIIGVEGDFVWLTSDLPDSADKADKKAA